MAQNSTLKGVVVDSANQPVIGAFVVEQGTNNGTMTGVDGDFAITTRRGASVEISCIGYVSQVIVNDGAQNLVVVLEDDAGDDDIVIGKDFFGGTIDLQVSFNEEVAYRFIGDGLIVSTPIGSTGYNRSARGRVLSYSDDRYVATAICPHNIELESKVLGRNDETEIVLMNKKYSASIYIDGSHIGPFDTLRIRCSDKKLILLRKPDEPEYQEV